MTTVPVALGESGFVSNAQDEFEGIPVQVSAKLMPEPEGANAVRGITRL